MPMPRSALLPNGYAMISRRAVRRAIVLLIYRAAERSAPMMGIERSRFSRRTILFLIVLLGTPLAAQSATLEDSARELARKIAAALPTGDLTSFNQRNDVTIEIRNLSSLMPEELVRVDQSLKAELLRWGIGAPASNGVTAKVVVTLSENLKDHVWTAEIHQGDVSHVFLTSAPRPMESRILSSVALMSFHEDKIWEGPERIVDVTFVVLPSFEQRMVLLVPEGLIITRAEHGATFKKFKFPPAETVARQPAGNLQQVGNHVGSWLDGRGCDFALDTMTLVQCNVRPSAYDLLQETVVDLDGPKFGDQVREIPSNCGISNPTLVTGTGDYTQPDSIRIFKDKSQISNELSFPGPVIRLSQGPDTQFAVAIVHNLKDGNYEVYRLSMSCGQ
jgi:hypothetical protein